eukprot:TRINITY_DN905_c0_g1_i2.p1 TRINITY_DN905_c0_g1~~TRINITY_DN905_c0_g1_i2.p1  ORF type:complete len:797 (+),score=89.75 TRINITY_DN905_c0_g1_i2:274-2664(+)
METARRRGERLCPSTSGFTTFKSERFRSISASSTCPIRQWLNYLPQRDSHKRFSGPALKSLILRLERRLEEMRDPDWYTPQAILERVIQANAREGRDVPQKLRDDILACPLTPLPDDQTLALLLYSAELYADEASVPPQSAPFQLYSELNRICREYAHADSPDANLKADWELFRPFAAHLQAAISALPQVQTTLYRGASYAIDAEVFRCGVRGSWGGLVSASSDRRQAVSFVSREAGLQSSDGSYFIITADAARPIYHLSEFPAEMEYLHPLDLELEVVSFVPFFLLTKASVNSSVAILKRAGLDLSFEASLGVRSCITYVLEEFFSTYIVPPVKPKLEDEPSPIDDHIQDFLRSSDHTLFVTGESGIGKSSLAIWLTNHGEHEGWTFLYCCVGCLLDPLETGAFLRALSYKYGFGDRANREIRSRRIVVVIDNFYINTHGRPTLHAANGLSTNDFKLILVCRQHQLQEYRDWCGPQSRQLLLQPFNDDNIAQFIGLRVRDSASPERRVSSRLSRPDTGNVARVSTGPAEDTVLQQLRDLRFWEQCRLPSILRMVTDLSLADPRILPTLPTLFEFNVRWLSWHCKSRGSDDVEADLRRVESLAWEAPEPRRVGAVTNDAGKPLRPCTSHARLSARRKSASTSSLPLDLQCHESHRTLNSNSVGRVGRIRGSARERSVTMRRMDGKRHCSQNRKSRNCCRTVSSAGPVETRATFPVSGRLRRELTRRSGDALSRTRKPMNCAMLSSLNGWSSSWRLWGPHQSRYSCSWCCRHTRMSLKSFVDKPLAACRVGRPWVLM